ncbi:hypothetical protein COCC4DRAFT_178822 [Bipolaris maydis ATCC 48331]|uniref:RRM domain-containing protein n=2 Tax=Cochliobolus heterostrophus TaxID=5016 RepID=M2UD76_COCH5|nr:uncharacterized protein COCC4DRAFT_178822 [Bipolaris maydis ATCC 48331]EMD96509.1 hypothetical protein COCHEDRAFT_1122856 [Bipolaris maydis C5]KAJ5060357.1 hypothetical protein J3E74DRAFT_244790 [Bipolaris maydis]ENI00663.1 hypothetical protein COCC4DRAFT_178822 [Bipolaris maydis ATCC 48331]KAJ6201810.1 hypothetical protein J3E72DRAFT_209463 [Bipolaris maydis]KAJ6211161.1 hypothetical protein PSV09DRAFT_1122856 [Bipolaris maydis]
MAVSRLLSRSHLLCRASAPCIRAIPSAIPSITSSLPRRTFTSSISAWEEIVHTPSRGPEIALTDDRTASAGNTANSIVLLKLSKRLSRGNIEEFLRENGFIIKKLQMRVDRFTFHNDTMCFVELGSPEEVQRAIKKLDQAKLQNKSIVVQPLKADFQWGHLKTSKNSPYVSRFFNDEGDAAQEALRPLAEGRRMMLSVKTPGWSPNAKVSEARNNAAKIIEENFGKYGVESLSDMAVFFGDKKQNPRLLGWIDFKTKEGAEQAAAEKHNTEINGRLVWLQAANPSKWRVEQYSKSAPQLVQEMQEKGTVSKEMDEDKFVTPLPKKQSN